MSNNDLRHVLIEGFRDIAINTQTTWNGHLELMADFAINLILKSYWHPIAELPDLDSDVIFAKENKIKKICQMTEKRILRYNWFSRNYDSWCYKSDYDVYYKST